MQVRWSRLFIYVVACLIAMASLTVTVSADQATSVEMDQVCQNWLTYRVVTEGHWDGAVAPAIDSMRQLYQDDLLLANVYYISPRGHVVVPVLKELAPIKACSENDGIDVSQTQGYTQLLRDVLSDRMRLFVEAYGSLDSSQPEAGEVLLGRKYRQMWDRFAIDNSDFAKNLESTRLASNEEVGPLLNTHWDQGDPYNDLCPIGYGGGICVVGCVATSYAQVMAYHQWPPEGVGTISYYWNGDYSCGGEGTPGGQQTAYLSDPYDWDNMPLRTDFGYSPEEAAAASELCREVGVAVHMGYGVCGSGAWPSWALETFPDHFGYDSSIHMSYRSNHSASSWFDLLKAEIDAARPIPYLISGHQIVCDGWRVVDDLNQYHMNYGWADSHDRWYTVDEVYCPWDGCDPMIEYAVINMFPDKAVLFEADTTLGWVPLDVQFTGSSNLTVDSWTWDLGDGDSAFIQSPAHIYSVPGAYDVTLQVDAGGDVRFRTKENYILALADSLLGQDVTGAAGSTVEVVIRARNTIPLSSIKVPVEGSGVLEGLALDSFSTVGCRTELFEQLEWSHWDGFNQRWTIGLIAGTGPDLVPGEGDVLKLYFTIPGSADPGLSEVLSFAGYGSYAPIFEGDLGQYPARCAGCLLTVDGSCCVGIRGNVNSDPDDLVNVADLTFLVAYLFSGGQQPGCWSEGDVNGDIGNQINIADLTFLVAYLFSGGSPPPECP